MRKLPPPLPINTKFENGYLTLLIERESKHAAIDNRLEKLRVEFNKLVDEYTALVGYEPLSTEERRNKISTLKVLVEKININRDLMLELLNARNRS